MRSPGIILVLSLMIPVFLSCSEAPRNGVSWLKQYDYPFRPDARKVVYKYVYESGTDYDTVNHILTFFADSEKMAYHIRGEYAGVTTFEDQYLIKDHSKILSCASTRVADNEYLVPGSYQGDVIYFTEIDDEKEFKPVKTKICYNDSDGFKLTHEDENAFVERTFIEWQDTLRSTLKFSFSSERWVNLKYIPFIRRTVSSSEGFFYYAEGVGLIRQEFVGDDGSVVTLDLVDIDVIY
jgi:hypothetical protein